MTPTNLALHRSLEDLFHGRWQALRSPLPWTPGFDPRGAAIRQAAWQVAPLPDELQTRWVEQLVEASQTAALEQALTAKPDALVVDFDDTFSPTAANLQAGYANLVQLRGRSTPLVMLRPRPLYMEEANGACASLHDLAVFVEACPERETLYVYLPKLEFPAEAEFWNDLLTQTERQFGRALYSIRVCLQIETLPAAFYADELLYALRHRAFGLNAGRWDYVFSAIKWLGQDPSFCFPERGELHMGQPSMRAYEQQLARVCARRGAQAIGGTAALAPDLHHPELALALVRADKEREASQGYVAAWAGLPGLIPTVRAVFQSPPPVSRPPPMTEQQVAAELLAFPRAQAVPLPAVREAIDISVTYFRAWLAGHGVIVRQGRVEDTATAELARTQLWQWVHHCLPLDTGEALTPERFEALLLEGADPQEPAARLLRALVHSPTCPAFFPAVARTLQEVPST
ncbi:malate synthase A [Deinococcus sp. QL22]|uniref:malate synthase A n=1 Tax=Deinococcus sp. QL22 TaxID=2939437 RepID=UPI002017361D|nr:malate synthase A [Deinococcus sp. QL22]UQN08180.1 malate synthase A [Deinococcus sp. QL22]